jgi:protein arginine kinase activator
MNCDYCGTIRATVKFTSVDEKGIHHLNLCRGCAEKSGIPIPGETAVPSPPQHKTTTEDILIEQFAKILDHKVIPNKVCPACSLTLTEFTENGLLGCVECYEAFQEELKPFIHKSFTESVYSGQLRPQSEGKKDSSKRLARNVELSLEHQLELMQLELELAVQEENYEKAAQLRDKVQELSKRLEDKKYQETL